MKNKNKNFYKISGWIVALAVTLTGVSTADAEWLNQGMGSIPPNAILGGREANGQGLYICRAVYGNGLHPGKIRRGFHACNIPWGGREISVHLYHVAVHSNRTHWEWKNGLAGTIPNGAVLGGNEPNGEALYLCRANINGGTHPGKIKLGFRGCYVPYGGKEMKMPTYQVMVGVIE